MPNNIASETTAGSSPFTQPLNRKDFLVRKQPKSPVASSCKNINVGNGDLKPPASPMKKSISCRGAARKSPIVSPRLGSPSKLGKGRLGQMDSSGHCAERSYEDVLAGLPEELPLDSSNNTFDRTNDGLGSASCHSLDRGNKLKVRFGDTNLHQSCPITNDNLPLQPRVLSGYNSQPISSQGFLVGESPNEKQLDLTCMSKSGICLSALPTVSEKVQTVMLRKDNLKDAASNLVFESIRGDRLATIEGKLSQTVANQRVMTDASGNVYAVIIHTETEGQNRFKICGPQPMYPDQRKSRESGLFTYAEVKNTSGIAIRFSMKLRGDTMEKYVTESFGPSIFKWGRGSPRGFVVKNKSGDECARITFLGGAKAVSVEPEHDVRLMLCYAAVIDEMLGKRLR